MSILSKYTKHIGSIAAGVAAFGLTTIVVTVSAASGVQASTPTPTPTPSAAQQQPVPEREIGEVKPILHLTEISFPLDEFRPDAESENVVLKAEQQLTQDCMQRFDMTFDQPVWSVPVEIHDYDRLFGLINLDEVKTYGYHLPGESPSESGLGNPKPEVAPTNVPEADYMAAFMGEADSLKGVAIPEGGCIGEARTTLGDDYGLQFLIEEGVNFGLSQSNLDPRVTEAFAEWSICMFKAGYEYATPSNAINDPHWNTNSVRATPAEIDVAVADVQCKIDTNLTGIRVAVATAWQDQFIRDHATGLKESVAAFAKQLSAAKSIR